MSVYTELTVKDIQNILSDYNLGSYLSHQGISAGVENTNYFVQTDQQSLVLTLFEKLDVDQLPFYLDLAEHLHLQGCKVPQPFRNKTGEFIKIIKNKPAVLVERVRGEHVPANPEHAIEIAQALAENHRATHSFNQQNTHSHGAAWVMQTAGQIQNQFNAADKQLLMKCVDAIKSIPNDLPKGVIHADLFQDNALFDQDNITGIIDWYFAGNDSYILDIAIAMNDWCLTTDQRYDRVQGEAFIAAYQNIRPLSEAELAHLPAMQIQAATRFWLSRHLAQQDHQASTKNITVKDPNDMKQLAAQLINYTER